MPSNLVGIVGPNGCGKSNVIDAVRWVMGESSAKHLRGDSMADVIFNGSSSRKPIGQATIELVFDNSDGTLGGQYASYSDISIKRTVSRDGQSVYSLNGTRCRRRDITDIFLGTGLGPRSYAIVEQGTISRLIEAKPEELRMFIEEAAGVSKYKERRRETENRMRHTRENLERLSDLLDELEKQLSRLKRQARMAKRYKVLKQEERLCKAQLQALRWQGLDENANAIQNQIKAQETALEAALARQRNVESEIEKQRQAHTEATDTFNEVQSRFYGLGADIGRLEQSIQHAKERRQQLQQDLAQLNQDGSEAETHMNSDRTKVANLQASLDELIPLSTQAQTDAQGFNQHLAQAEQAMQDWQAQWEVFYNESMVPAQRAEVERTRIQHLEQQITQSEQRIKRLEEELAKESPEALASEVDTLKQDVENNDANLNEDRQGLAQQQAQINQLRDEVYQLSTQLDDGRGDLQDSGGRRASLEALQEAALGKQQEVVTDWLVARGLESAPRLAEKITVEPGWEYAVECVLGGNLKAVCVSGLDPLSMELDTFDEGTLFLFDTTTQATALAHGTTLKSKIDAPWSLDTLLAGVYVADSLQQALAMRSGLTDHESVVIREGFWFGPDWLRVIRTSAGDSGVLQRERELKVLVEAMQQASQSVGELASQLEAKQERLLDLESGREHSQSALNQAAQANAHGQAQLSAFKTRLEQVRVRQAQLRSEMDESASLLEQNRQEMAQARLSLQQAVDQVSGVEQQREAQVQRRDMLREALDQARAQVKKQQEKLHDLTLRVETLRTELNTTQQSLQRMEDQLAQLTTRREELHTALSDGDAPLQIMGDELEALLEKRMVIETELTDARHHVESIEESLRGREEQRGETEQGVQQVREELEQIRMGWQEVRVRRTTLEEQVTETGFDLKSLLQEIPSEANEIAWQEKLKGLERKIGRLGLINLAAIEEFEQLSERKTYLDAQHADLTEALEILQNAIHKIDRETRTRFKDTYDKLNISLQALFPRLFGGGHAYLEMTSEDLLNTGITVMARPPGKRNSIIQLLSGGEKALTAIAMVFALFELNPSPFCMLDEVDAPLDDANVMRYCELLKELAERTQLIFITHNKITMEVAKHLTGVTMNEPGVSHLVAVDVDEAIELAAS